MHYNFPIITNIDDVLPHIKDREEFIVIEKDDYTVIDYILQSQDTFPNVEIDGGVLGLNDCLSYAIRRECRGLIFDKKGKLISRPFQKFFNYGEKPEEQTGLGLPEAILTKLDGSMIRPLIIDGNIRLATRKGITDIAMQAEEFAAGKENYITFISAMCNSGWTPIFEWCSRNNQIVIDYPEDTLVLLALRQTETGKYMGYKDLLGTANNFKIPLVTLGANSETTLEEAVSFAKHFKDNEGYVMVWPNGHRMKAKSDWYVTMHRAKDAIGREKDLIKLYLTTGVDDIIPLLPETYKQEVCSFLAKLTEELVTTCQRLDGIFVNTISKLEDTFTRKDFALEVLKLDPKYKSIMFSLLPGTPCMEVVINILLKACSNKKLLNEHRWLIGNIRFQDKTTEEKGLETNV